MGDSKHTKGPWEARTFLVRGGERMSDTICHVGTSTNLPPRRSNESEANARLIAAAPEMLAMLRVCRATFAFAAEEGDVEANGFIAEIDAVLAKAVGP